MVKELQNEQTPVVDAATAAQQAADAAAQAAAAAAQAAAAAAAAEAATTNAAPTPGAAPPASTADTASTPATAPAAPTADPISPETGQLDARFVLWREFCYRYEISIDTLPSKLSGAARDEWEKIKDSNLHKPENKKEGV